MASITSDQGVVLKRVFRNKGITGSIQNKTLNYSEAEVGKYLGDNWTKGDIKSVHKAFSKCATIIGATGGLSEKKLDEWITAASAPKTTPKAAPKSKDAPSSSKASSSKLSGSKSTMSDKEYDKFVDDAMCKLRDQLKLRK